MAAKMAALNNVETGASENGNIGENNVEAA